MIGTRDLLLRIKEALSSFWPELTAEILLRTKTDSKIDVLFLGRLAKEWSRGVIESVNSMYYERLFITTDGVIIPEITDVEIQKLSNETSALYYKTAEV
jgi:hypothetical protein